MPVSVAPSQTLDPYTRGMSAGTDNVLEAYAIAPRTSKVNPLGGRNVTTFNMDEAYDNESLQLRDTVFDWMWTKNRTWYTERIMPWRVIDDIFVEWKRWEANAHIMGATPHQATGRLISQRRSTRRASLIRRSLAMQIENDWADTRLGRESIVIGVGQFADSYQETANFEVIRALLHAHHYNQQQVRETGKVRRLDHIEYLSRQKDNFARVQKDVDGLALWDDETDAEAHVYRGMFDSLIVPDRMLSYVTMVRPENVEYARTGRPRPTGIETILDKDVTVAEPQQQRLADGVGERRRFNGKDVYQARAYHVEGVQPVELLAKPVQVGEYNWMCGDHCQYSDGKYRTDHRDIMIFDEDKDRYSVLNMSAALTYCGLFDNEGNLRSAKSSDGGNVNPRDLARDFLMRYDPSVNDYVPVQFFGDIGDAFMTSDTLQNVADTLYHAIFKTQAEKEAADGLVSNISTTLRQELQAGPVSLVDIQNMFQPNIIGDTAGKRLINILGRGNLFDKNTSAASIKSFIGGNLVPVYKGSARNALPDANSHGGKFLRMVKSWVDSDADKAHIDSLYQESASKSEFARHLGDFLGNDAAIGTSGGFKTQQEFRNIYESRAEAQFVNNPNIEMTPHVNTGREIVYTLRGQNLAAGHEYVNASDAYGDPSSLSSFPTHVDSIFQMNGTAPIQSNEDAMPMMMEQDEDMGYQRGFHGASIGAVPGMGANDEGINRMKQTYREGYDSSMPRDVDPTRYNMMNKHLETIGASSMSDIKKILAAMFLGAPVTRQQCQKFLTFHIAFVMNFLILRPHAAYRGRTAIKVLGGGGAGNTYFGHGRAEVGHDASRMITLLHSAAYMAAIVDHEENVYAEGNLMVDRYYGGLGMRFYTPETYQSRQSHGNAESIIVCALPPNETREDLPQYLDIAGRYFTDYDNGLIDLKQNDELHYSMALRYDLLFGMYSRADAVDEINFPTVLPDDSHNNRICSPGAQFMKDSDGKYTHYEYNQGAWGATVYPGCGEVRNGKRKHLDASRMTQCIQSVR